MTFSIRDFSAQVNKAGLAKSNIFLVEITPPSGLGADARQVMFMSKSVSIPGINLESGPVMNNPIGPPETVLHKIGKDPLSIQVMMDSNFTVNQFFHNWMQLIVNFNSGQGVTNDAGGKMPYEFGYRSEYTGVVTVRVFSQHMKDIYYEYVFSGAFPTTISGTEHSWENAAEIITLPVAFTYNDMSVSGVGGGTVSEIGVGSREYSPTYRNIVEKIRTSQETPAAVQNIVNQVATGIIAYNKPELVQPIADFTAYRGDGVVEYDVSESFENTQGGLWLVDGERVAINQGGILRVDTNEVGTETVYVSYENEYGKALDTLDIIVEYMIPTVINTIPDQTILLGQPSRVIDVSEYFGVTEGGTWSVVGPSASIDQNGIVTLLTDVVVNDEITVTYTNASGSASTTFNISITN